MSQPKRRFVILKHDDVPTAALTWEDASERRRRMENWRQAVFHKHGRSSRAVRVAWVLADLFNTKDGYAFPSNAYLADKTGLPLDKVENALADLDGSAILRVHRENGGRMQRHIYPKMMQVPTRRKGGSHLPAEKEGINPPLGHPPKRRDRIRKRTNNTYMSPEDAHARAEAWRADM
jgi:hypothetical protein